MPQDNHDTSVRATMPYIIGADFGGINETIGQYQSIIDAVPKSNEKRRVLFVSEASYLRTGFATYINEVMTRLHQSGNFILGELGAYGEHPDIDERAAKIPWTYYHNIPTSHGEALEYGMVDGKVIHEGYNNNQFGKWKFDKVVANFKPDIVVTIRDNWHDRFILSSPLRPMFKWSWMATVDGYPQQWSWIKDYNKVDSIFAYSWFGKRVLEEQSRCPLAKLAGVRPIDVVNVCSAGASPAFRPMDKNEVRRIFGVPDDIRLIGTVMRNQPRKLFPRIIESFYRLKRDFPVESKNVFLLLHTSIPDVGWDIPAIVVQYGLTEHVLYTYHCLRCGNLAISGFRGSPTSCPVCHSPDTFMTPNTKYGITPEHLNLVYNLMDVYIQGSIAEGEGMPLIEAKAAGLPCLTSDYSAMYEKARNGGALPIENETIFTEHETGQWRSLFSRKDLTKKLAMLLSNENKRRKMSQEAFECANKYHTWDLCAKKWEAHLLTTKIHDRSKTWDSPEVIQIKVPSQTSAPDGLSDAKFIEWLYINILCRKGVDPEGLQHWSSALRTKAITRSDLENKFRTMVANENNTKQLISSNGEHIAETVNGRILNTIIKCEGPDAL